jgi:uncharacterized membrane protein
MTVNISQISPFMWIVIAAVALVVVFGVIRFFWQHVLKLVFKVGLVLLGVVAVVALLRYLGVF